MDMTAEELIARLGHLKARRVNFDNQWQEVKDLVWPDTADFQTQRSPGEKTNTEIYDMTTAIALEQGAAAMETFLTPRTQRWHRLVPSDPKLREDVRVKEWFEAASDVLFTFRNSPRAKFSSQMHEGWKALLAFGNNCLFVKELPTGGTSYRYTHIGSTWMDTDAEDNVDTIFYEYRLTAKAACARWKDKAPKCAKNALKATPFAEHTYIHAVMPNAEHDPDVVTPKAMAFKAYEVSVDDKAILEEGGYHELPYMWSRYTVNPSEVYGRGPAMLVLPDIKTLQQMERVFLRSGQKVADPPLLAPSDGSIGRGNKRIQLGAGKVTYGGVDPATGKPLLLPLQTGARLDMTLEMANQRRQLIRSAFFLDFFEILVQDRVEMTATEVLERAREKGQLLSPIVGRQQSEMLGPLIEREIKIAQRQGKLPPLPPALVEAKGDYEIEYESDATRMQKSAEVSALSRALEAVAPFIEANPSLLSVWKQDAVIRHAYETMGGPTRLVTTATEYEDIETAQAEAQAQAAQVEALPQVAKGMRDLSAAASTRAA